MGKVLLTIAIVAAMAVVPNWATIASLFNGTTPTPTPNLGPPGVFRCMVVYDTNNAAQSAVMNDAQVTEYLVSHTEKDGKEPAYRLVDTTTDLSSWGPTWQSMRKAATTPPQIVITKSGTTEVFALPDTSQKCLEWLQQIGGTTTTPTTQAAPAYNADLLVFGADWCGACKKLEIPDFTVQKIKTTRIDTDSDPDTTTRYNVRELPTYIVLWAGHEVARGVGYRTPEQFQQWLATVEYR